MKALKRFVLVFLTTFLELLIMLLALIFAFGFFLFVEVLPLPLVFLGHALLRFAQWITPLLSRGSTWLLPRLLEAGQLLLSHWAQSLAVLVLVHVVVTLHRTGKALAHRS